MSTRPTFATGLAAGLLLVVLGGCMNPFSPRVAPVSGITVPPPVPSTPEDVIRLFAWCWNHRAYPEYEEIFSDDYVFVFAQGDTAGNTRSEPIDREEELIIAKNLFIGGAIDEPPANRIVLNIDPSLHAVDDNRRGKDPGWHKEVFTSIDLTISTDTQDYRVTGSARFYVVRGDSALIPQAMKDKGFGPDPNRWYIEQHSDETYQPLGPAAGPSGAHAAGSLRLASLGPSPTRATPSENLTLGQLFLLYLDGQIRR